MDRDTEIIHFRQGGLLRKQIELMERMAKTVENLAIDFRAEISKEERSPDIIAIEKLKEEDERKERERKHWIRAFTAEALSGLMSDPEMSKNDSIDIAIDSGFIMWAKLEERL